MTTSLRTLTLALSAGALLSGASHAAPMISLGDSVDLFFNGSATIRTESNVLQTETDEEADTSFIFSPGLELLIGKAGRTDFNGRIILQEQFIRYSEMNEDDPATTYDENLNSTLPYLYGSAQYLSGPTAYNGSVGYIESQNNAFAGTQGPAAIPGAVEKTDITFDNYLEVELSPKTSIGAGFNYTSNDYDNDARFGYTDSSSWSIPADAYYEISPKLDASLGYTYRSVDVDGAASDAQDHILNVGLRGEFTPKLTGSTRIGYITRKFDIGSMDDQSDMFVNASLTYKPTPLTTFSLTGFRDFSVAVTGGSTVINTGANVRAQYNFSPVFGLAARVGYEVSEYDDQVVRTQNGAAVVRDDDYYSLGVELSYNPNAYITFIGGYTYSNNDSSWTGLDFTNNVVEVSAMFRY